MEHYRVTSKGTHFSETRTVFDRTDMKDQVTAGSHQPSNINGEVDVSAFSFARKTARRATSEFTRKGTGTGGLSGVEARSIMEKQLNEFAETHPVKKTKKETAWSVRPNPPNTDFRRHYERGDLPVVIKHEGSRRRLAFKIDVTKLDYHH